MVKKAAELIETAKTRASDRNDPYPPQWVYWDFLHHSYFRCISDLNLKAGG